MYFLDFGVIILALVLIVAGGYTLVHRARPEIVDDNQIEEIIEDILEHETGVDIDLTPETKE